MEFNWGKTRMTGIKKQLKLLVKSICKLFNFTMTCNTLGLNNNILAVKSLHDFHQ